MKAVVLDQDQSLTVRTLPIPIPGPGKVLVRMEASPINPSDLLFLEGAYPTKIPFPCTPGFEGSGTVIENGGGYLGWTLVNKRVAVVSGFDSPHGCWAEYCVVDSIHCLKLSDETTFDQGSSSFVNPMTVLMFMEFIQQNRHKSVIHTAAASALGKMLLRQCINANIPLINIVRRAEQVEQLRNLGAVYVLNSSDEGFEAQLHALTERLETTVAFDAVGGKLTGLIFNALRPQGTVYVYGMLSGKHSSGLSASGLVFHGKRVEGAWLGPWLGTKGCFELLSISSKVMKLINSDLKTDYQRLFDLDHVGDAITLYRTNMTAGKVLIKPAALLEAPTKSTIS